MNENFPKISVIIPVYNAEKYFPVCLESLLIQTFTDFEVIVVDDCSTDNSVAIAENYLERFGERLKIFSLEENTGSGAIPRNVGLEVASGKYIFFVDSDDLLIDVALEELYNCAEESGAEVVYMNCGFLCGAEILPKSIVAREWDPTFSVEEPTFELDDLNERVKKFLKNGFVWSPWTKFLRRDFLIDNGIKFPSMRISEDGSWTLEIICLAKKILRTPSPLYIWRSNENSMTRSNRSPEQNLIFWINPLINGLDYIEEFMSNLDFFKQNPAVRLEVLELFATIHLQRISEAFKALEPQEAYEIFLREFSKAGSSQPALIAYLLVMNNLYRNELAK